MLCVNGILTYMLKIVTGQNIKYEGIMNEVNCCIICDSYNWEKSTI